MNPTPLKPPRPESEARESPGEAVAAVVESASALLRAELRLITAEASAWFMGAMRVLALLGLALLLTQVLVLSVATLPLLVGKYGGLQLALVPLLALTPAALAVVFLSREVRRLKGLTHANRDQAEQRNRRD